MSRINDLISMLPFVEAKIGGLNSYFNPSAQPKFKLAWITAHKDLLTAGDNGVVIGDNVYTAKVSKGGRPYINCLNKAVVELELSDANKALLEEYDNAVKGANQKNLEYKAQNQPVEEEPTF